VGAAAEGCPWNNATSRSTVGGADDDGVGWTAESTVDVPETSAGSSLGPPTRSADGGAQNAERSALEAINGPPARDWVAICWTIAQLTTIAEPAMPPAEVETATAS